MSLGSIEDPSAGANYLSSSHKKREFQMGLFCRNSRYTAGRVLAQCLIFIGWLVLVSGLAMFASAFIDSGTLMFGDQKMFSADQLAIGNLAYFSFTAIPLALSILVPSYIMLGVLDLAAKANRT